MFKFLGPYRRFRMRKVSSVRDFDVRYDFGTITNTERLLHCLTDLNCLMIHCTDAVLFNYAVTTASDHRLPKFEIF